MGGSSSKISTILNSQRSWNVLDYLKQYPKSKITVADMELASLVLSPDNFLEFLDHVGNKKDLKNIKKGVLTRTQSEDQNDQLNIIILKLLKYYGLKRISNWNANKYLETFLNVDMNNRRQIQQRVQIISS
uniref:Uncharacterized protein n=1 Tax=viral metagenome TaxID=1070528 RepID=A0A6C0K1B5_9ZZZZ